MQMIDHSNKLIKNYHHSKIFEINKLKSIQVSLKMLINFQLSKKIMRRIKENSSNWPNHLFIELSKSQ